MGGQLKPLWSNEVSKLVAKETKERKKSVKLTKKLDIVNKKVSDLKDLISKSTETGSIQTK